MTGYLTLLEAAKLLRVSTGTVAMLARREGLPLSQPSQSSPGRIVSGRASIVRAARMLVGLGPAR